jgi:hypothetical protein
MPSHRGTKLKLVSENDADGRTQEIYAEVRHALGVPQVSALFRAYAVYPKFLERFWTAFRPGVQTPEFFRLGDRIRAEAYTRIHNYFQVPDLRTPRQSSSAARLAETIDLFHYLDPLLLLMAVTQMRAFETPVGREHNGQQHPEHPVFDARPVVVEAEFAAKRTRAIFDEIKRTLGQPALSAAYICFAEHPEFLESYWMALKPVSRSALYTEIHSGLLATAWALAREFPARVELTVADLAETGMSDSEIASVARVTEVFVDALSRLVLNVAFAKIGMEGGTPTSAPTATPEEGEPKQAA